MSPDSVVREENISAIVVQMRLRGEKTSDTVKNEWSTRITQLGYLNDSLSVLGLFRELTDSNNRESGLEMYPTVKITVPDSGLAVKQKMHVNRSPSRISSRNPEIIRNTTLEQ